MRNKMHGAQEEQNPEVREGQRPLRVDINRPFSDGHRGVANLSCPCLQGGLLSFVSNQRSSSVPKSYWSICTGTAVACLCLPKSNAFSATRRFLQVC